MNKNILKSAISNLAISGALLLVLLPLAHANAVSVTASATSTAPSAPVMAPSTVVTPSTVMASPSPSMAPAYCPQFNTDLRYGQAVNKDRKDDIMRLQLFLERENLFSYSGSLGTFGPLTLASVKKFQAKYGLPATGFVGPMTRAKIHELAGCGSIIVPPPLQVIKIKTPNGGEKWDLFTNQYIQWTIDPVYAQSHPNAKFDIDLIQRMTGRCPFTVTPCVTTPVAPFPYELDNNISGNQYYWIAGTDIADRKIPRGDYVIQVCTAGESPKYCGTSDAAFKLTEPAYEANREPVITEIVGPTTIKLGETAVWTVKASDPEGGNLAYEGAWGKTPFDWNVSGYLPFVIGSNSTQIKFPATGTYTLEFIVSDAMWKSVKKTMQVTVN